MARKFGRGSDGDDREEVEFYLHRQTPDAWCVSTDGDSNQAEWLPKSQVDVLALPAVVGRENTFLVPQWLLERKGLV